MYLSWIKPLWNERITIFLFVFIGSLIGAYTSYNAEERIRYSIEIRPANNIVFSDFALANKILNEKFNDFSPKIDNETFFYLFFNNFSNEKILKEYLKNNQNIKNALLANDSTENSIEIEDLLDFISINYRNSKLIILSLESTNEELAKEAIVHMIEDFKVNTLKDFSIIIENFAEIFYKDFQNKNKLSLEELQESSKIAHDLNISKPHENVRLDSSLTMLAPFLGYEFIDTQIKYLKNELQSPLSSLSSYSVLIDTAKNIDFNKKNIQYNKSLIQSSSIGFSKRVNFLLYLIIGLCIGVLFAAFKIFLANDKILKS